MTVVWVRLGSPGGGVPTRRLFANPREECLEQRRCAQGVEAVIDPSEVRIAERRVDLLMARLAQRRAVLCLAALLFRLEMVQGDQANRHIAVAQFAAKVPVLIGARLRSRHDAAIVAS